MFTRVFLSLMLIFPAREVSAELTKETLTFFLKESYVKYGLRDPKHADVAMYEIAETTTDVAEFLPAFAKRVGVTEADAALWAKAIIEAVSVREQCQKRRNTDACKFEPGSKLFHALTGVAAEDASGSLALPLIKGVIGYTDPGKMNSVLVLEAIAQHPAYDQIVYDLFEYSRDLEWLMAVVAYGSQNEAFYQDLLASSRFFRQFEHNTNGDLAALLEIAAETAQENGRTDHALFAQQALMKTMLSNGMGTAALDMFDGLSNQVRAAFFTEARNIRHLRRRRAALEAVYDLGAGLVAARIVQEGVDSSAARTLFAEVRSMESAKLRPSPEVLVLQDIFDAQYGANDLYDLYLHGVSSEPGRAAFEIVWDLAENGSDDRPTGWGFALASSGAEINWIASDRLDQVGLVDIAAQNRADMRLGVWQGSQEPGVIEIETRLLPKNYADRKERWRREILAANEMWQQRRDAAIEPGAETRSHVIQRTLPKVFDETGGVEPDGQVCARSTPGVKASWPDDAPVGKDQAVRFEQNDTTRAIVYLSGEYDRPGEMPGWSYFVQFDKGNGWERPLFLGLQQHFPYVLHKTSSVPMLGQQGRLILEANIEEIDMDNMVFPPIGVGLSRQRCGVLLDFDLEALGQDSDGDWITDLTEVRLGMDPLNKDTDGDGIVDGFDTLPLTQFGAASSAMDTEVALSLLQAMMGIERNAIMVTPGKVRGSLQARRLPGEDVLPALDTQFIQAEPDLFAGLSLPFRLFVYDKGDLGKLNRGKAPFYPPRVTAMFRRPDGSETYVKWSAQWTGGSFLIRCDEATQSCQMISLGYWIT